MAQSEVSNTRGYRGLLAVVIILGILIIVGVIGLIVGFALRLSRAQGVGPFSATVSAPGERVESVQADGNRILLRLSGPKGEELVIMDSTGRVLGRIAINTGP
jgi:hypothetical protein